MEACHVTTDDVDAVFKDIQAVFLEVEGIFGKSGTGKIRDRPLECTPRMRQGKGGQFF
jgi:hypothetical protein